MDLQEVRGRINELDRLIKFIYDERLECSKLVGEVKLETHDEVYKPIREKEIYARYSNDTIGLSHKSFIRKIVQLSRKYQYNMFIEQKAVDEEFYSFVEGSEVFDKGGILTLTLISDETGEKGLCMKDIFEIASDAVVPIVAVNTSAISEDESSFEVTIKFKVADTESMKADALLVSYMLYKETLK